MAFHFSSVRIPSARLWRTFRNDWWRLLRATWTGAGEDNLGLIAAGTAFYAFSSIAPILAATVLTYGLIATPDVVSENIRALFAVLPADAASLIGGQLDTVVSGSQGKKGFALVLALAIALYGGSKAASSMMTALNVTYGVKERRGIVVATLTALGIVAGGVVLILGGIAASALVALLSSLMPWAPGIVLTLIGTLSYVSVTLLAFTGASALYRFGPSVPGARFRWGTPGAVLATLLWLAATLGFGFYVSNFGNYGATYGSLSAIIVSLTWLWLSVYAYLLGAELDHQIAEQMRPKEESAPADDHPQAMPPLSQSPPPPPEKPRVRIFVTGAAIGAAASLLLLRRTQVTTVVEPD